MEKSLWVRVPLRAPCKDVTFDTKVASRKPLFVGVFCYFWTKYRQIGMADLAWRGHFLVRHSLSLYTKLCFCTRLHQRSSLFGATSTRLQKTHGGSWNELTMCFFYCFTAALAVFCGFSNNLAYRTCCASIDFPAQTGQPLFCERARE